MTQARSGVCNVDENKCVKILHQNICGLKTNQELLEIHTEIECPDILCISEHNLTQVQFDSLVYPDFTNVSSFCIQSRRKGGVCILAREGMSFDIVNVSQFTSEDDCQMAAARFSLTCGQLLVIAVYRPPGYRCDAFLHCINECLYKLLRKQINVVVAGDFNVNVLVDDMKSRQFLNLMNSYGLRHTITTYTREVKESKTGIDNIFTNISHDAFFSRVVVTALSDHHAQEAAILFCKTINKVSPVFKMSRMFNASNTACFGRLLHAESWTEVYEGENLDEQFESFSSILKFYLDLAFPLRKVKCVGRRSSIKIHVSDRVRLLRGQVMDLYSSTRYLVATHPLKLSYLKLKREYRKLIRQEKSNMISRKVSSSSNTSKALWDVVNEHRSPVSPPCESIVLSDSNGKDIDDPLDVANTFCNYFASVGDTIPQSAVPSDTDSPISVQTFASSLFLCPASIDEVHDVIMSLKSKSSAGFDGISSRLLKQVADVVAPILTFLVNSSFETGKFPGVLKHSIIKPLHKKGSRKNCCNYRPISLVPTVSKVLEKLYLKRLLNFLMVNKLLSPQQFGFTKSKSTVDAMFSTISLLVEALDEQKPCFGIFFDLTKAFDLVNHDRLIDKAWNLGVRGPALSWLTTFIRGRSQEVQFSFIDRGRVIQTIQSEKSNVNIGVPQGSVLGPLLFLMYINDLPFSIPTSHMCLFADDTSIVVTAPNRLELEVKAQAETQKVLSWFCSNLLSLNLAKTQMMDFSIRSRPYRDEVLLTMGNDVSLYPVDSTTFLGLKVDEHLTFQLHIDYVCGKLSSGIYLIRKLSAFGDLSLLFTAYYGLVYSHLTYGVAIWGSESGRTRPVFRLQKRALRACLGKPPRFSCKQIFKKYNILTFPSLYILNCLTFAIKNRHLLNNNLTHYYNTRNVNRPIIPKHKTTFFEKHLKYNAIKFFNALPDYIKAIEDNKQFIKRTKSLLLNMCCYSVEEFLSWPNS